MTESYKDIEGPVTVFVKITIKPEYVDEFAKFVYDYALEYTNRSISCDIVRHENVFVTWEKFTGFDAIENSETLRTALIEFIKAKDNILKWAAEEPEIKFFATNSVVPAG